MAVPTMAQVGTEAVRQLWLQNAPGSVETDGEALIRGQSRPMARL